MSKTKYNLITEQTSRYVEMPKHLVNQMHIGIQQVAANNTIFIDTCQRGGRRFNFSTDRSKYSWPGSKTDVNFILHPEMYAAIVKFLKSRNIAFGKNVCSISGTGSPTIGNGRTGNGGTGNGGTGDGGTGDGGTGKSDNGTSSGSSSNSKPSNSNGGGTAGLDQQNREDLGIINDDEQQIERLTNDPAPDYELSHKQQKDLEKYREQLAAERKAREQFQKQIADARKSRDNREMLMLQRQWQTLEKLSQEREKMRQQKSISDILANNQPMPYYPSPYGTLEDNLRLAQYHADAIEKSKRQALKLFRQAENESLQKYKSWILKKQEEARQALLKQASEIDNQLADMRPLSYQEEPPTPDTQLEPEAVPDYLLSQSQLQDTLNTMRPALNSILSVLAKKRKELDRASSPSEIERRNLAARKEDLNALHAWATSALDNLTIQTDNGSEENTNLTDPDQEQEPTNFSDKPWVIWFDTKHPYSIRQTKNNNWVIIETGKIDPVATFKKQIKAGEKMAALISDYLLATDCEKWASIAKPDGSNFPPNYTPDNEAIEKCSTELPAGSNNGSSNEPKNQDGSDETKPVDPDDLLDDPYSGLDNGDGTLNNNVAYRYLEDRASALGIKSALFKGIYNHESLKGTILKGDNGKSHGGMHVNQKWAVIDFIKASSNYTEKDLNDILTNQKTLLQIGTWYYSYLLKAAKNRISSDTTQVIWKDSEGEITKTVDVPTGYTAAEIYSFIMYNGGPNELKKDANGYYAKDNKGTKQYVDKLLIQLEKLTENSKISRLRMLAGI